MRIGKALKEKWGQHKALAELFIGIAAAGILILAVLLIFFDRHVFRSSGLALGLISAALGAWHMERTIISTYGQDEKNAIMIMRLGAVKRYLAALLVIGIGAYTGFYDPISAFAGIFTLKIAAYAAPWTHLITERVCGCDEAQTEANYKDGKESSADFFGYTEAERGQLDESLRKKNKNDQESIEKMRTDFSKYYEPINKNTGEL
jgi:hypothetical protein